jgi:hypothetical protein
MAANPAALIAALLNFCSEACSIWEVKRQMEDHVSAAQT